MVLFAQASTLALRLEPFVGDRNVLQKFLTVACADGIRSDRNATGCRLLHKPHTWLFNVDTFSQLLLRQLVQLMHEREPCISEGLLVLGHAQRHEPPLDVDFCQRQVTGK